jgi:phosphoribosyl 1,2-cyclic phosphate phosphodiesterase
MSEETFEDLRRKYYYLLHPKPEDPLNSPFFSWTLLKNSHGSLSFEGLQIYYMSYFQQGMRVLGFRIGNLAYLSDIKEYDESIFSLLQGVDVLILSALRHEQSYMHFSLEEAVAFSQRVAPKKTYFTHIAHEVEHERGNAFLSSIDPSIALSYDGLSIPFIASMT